MTTYPNWSPGQQYQIGAIVTDMNHNVWVAIQPSQDADPANYHTRGAWTPYVSGTTAAAPVAITADLPTIAQWAASTTYNQGEIVSYSGALYQAKSNFTSSTNFNAANWTQLAGNVTDDNAPQSGTYAPLLNTSGTPIAGPPSSPGSATSPPYIDAKGVIWIWNNTDSVWVKASVNATTKQAILPICGAGAWSGNPSTGFTDACQRTSILLPVTTTQWRLRFRNTSVANGVETGAFTFKPVYVGTPNIQSSGGSIGQWLGDFTAAPTQALAAFTTDSAGDEYVTPWVTSPSLQFQADVMSGLSWGFTVANGQNLLLDFTHMAMLWYGSGCSAQTGNQAAPTGGTLGIIGTGDMRLEVVTETTLPLVLVLGDSIVQGWMDDSTGVGSTQVSESVVGPHIPWPGQAALKNRMIMINAGIGSQTYNGAFASSSSWGFQRVLPTGGTQSTPDVCLLASGLNEAVNGTQSLATFLGNLKTTIGVIQGLGINRFYHCTQITPPVLLPGILTSGCASGATSLVTSQKVATAGSQAIVLDPSNELSETVTSTGASTGNGPYTTGVSATANAHGPGTEVGSSAYGLVAQYSQALRSGIFGSEGVFDLQEVFPPYIESYKKWWGSTGSTHPGAGGYAKIGAAVTVSNNT